MSSAREATVPTNQARVLQNRKTFWYTLNEIRNKPTCPSCGVSINKFKNITAHVKRCFSIKRIGPVYRLHGYVECKCGFLIADNTKAQKLHVCMGTVPAFEPDLSYMPKKPSSEDQQASDKRTTVSQHVEHELLQPKPWIRNFVSPFKLDIENVDDNPKPGPRVRNFDMPASKRSPQSVSVYSISSNNGSILITGQSSGSGTQDVLLIKRRSLRLPQLKSGKCS